MEIVSVKPAPSVIETPGCKGEIRNVLVWAVFMHGLGEIRDRDLENQSYRGSRLTLLTAVITLWNTVYIERTIESLKRKGVKANEQLSSQSAHFRLGAYQYDRRLYLALQSQTRLK
jgi:hypothetical protein